MGSVSRVRLGLRCVVALLTLRNFPGGSVVKNPPANAGDTGLIPGSGRFPRSRKWQPTPVFLPRKLHGQRSLSGYNTWGCKKLDTTERLSMPMLNIPSWKAQVISLTEESLARKRGIRFGSIHVNA